MNEKGAVYNCIFVFLAAYPSMKYKVDPNYS